MCDNNFHGNKLAFIRTLQPPIYVLVFMTFLFVVAKYLTKATLGWAYCGSLLEGTVKVRKARTKVATHIIPTVGKNREITTITQLASSFFM